jgi:hypothetical protein
VQLKEMAMKKAEYREGAEARKNFENTMMNLFRTRKPAKPKKQPKKKAASEEKKN